MNLTLRVTRNSIGTLTEELIIGNDDGSDTALSLSQYPKTLNRALTGAVKSTDEFDVLWEDDGPFGVLSYSDRPIGFYFPLSPSTAPLAVSFGDLKLPAKLEPNCTPEQAEAWAREYLGTLVRRLKRVEECRRSQLPEFSVSVSLPV